MEFERLNEEEKFGDLDVGDTFWNGNQPYMKVIRVVAYPQTNNSIIVNAIRLGLNTKFEYFSDSTLVIPTMFKLVEISDCGCE